MSFPGQALQRAWHLVDASNQTVGRLAGQIAQILKGKHKPTYRPNKDMGDYVVVINAEKVRNEQHLRRVYQKEESMSFFVVQL
jgi:large subunit ribosomal protein L13